MTEDVKDPKVMRQELLEKAAGTLPRLYTGMPKIPSPFGDGIPSQEFFREDVMIGAQWMRDHPLKRPFDKSALRPANEEDLAELEMMISTINPKHTPRSMNQLMFHLRMIHDQGLGMYAKSFLNPANSIQVGQ